MGRSKVAYRVYSQKRTWTTLDGKTHKQTNWRIRYWSGDILKTMATGKKTKAEAIKFAEDLARQGKFTFSPTFKDFASGFFEKEGNARSYSVATLYGRKKTLESVLIPWFGDKTLTELTTEYIEQYFQDLIDREERSKGTITNYTSTLSPIFAEAVRKGLLPNTPLTGVKLYSDDDGGKQAFKLSEIHQLLLESEWKPEKDDPENLPYWVSMIAAVSGMRIGEIQAIQKKHIRYIKSKDVLLVHVEQSFSPIQKTIGPTKTKGSVRFVPIVGMAKDWLRGRIIKTPSINGEAPTFHADDWFLFSSDGTQNKIVTQAKVNFALAKQYKKRLGVDKPEDKTFHSFRHFFNSRMLILTDHNEFLVKALMGHGKKNNMTINYMTTTPDKFLDVIPALSLVLGSVKDIELEDGQTVEAEDDSFTDDFGKIDSTNY